MAHISEETILTVRQKSDIVDLIGHYLSVSRKGKHFIALCPFHEDHTPSMLISPDKQIFKCFVCGAGGNVFSFVQRYEHVTFPEAVAKVASLAGVAVDIDTHDARPPVDPLVQRQYDLLAEAQTFFAYQFNTQEGAPWRTYLEQRGYHADVVTHFAVGCDPTDNSLTQFLSAKGYSEQELIGSSLSVLRYDHLEDLFARRLVFPIHDPQGRCIAFSARTIDPNGQPKYINSAETDIYTKGSTVYNYHRVAQQQRPERVLVVEGVFDVLAYHVAGIPNVVATLGTSFTKAQIRLIKRLSSQIVIGYDGDQAGQSAAYKLGKALHQEHVTVEVCYNDGQDPDELLRTQGAEKLRNLVETRIPWIEFVVGYHQRKSGTQRYESRKEIVAHVVEDLPDLEGLDLLHVVELLARITGFDETVLLNQFATPKRSVRRIETPIQSLAPKRLHVSLAELETLNQMLLSVQAIDLYQQELSFMPDRAADAAAMLILSHRDRQLTTTDLIALSSDDEEVNSIFMTIAQKDMTETVNLKALRQNIRQIKVYVQQKEIDNLRQKAIASLDLNEKAALIEKITSLQQSIFQLNDSINKEGR